MPTSNEALRDALIRHQTYLLRYSSHVRNHIWAILDKSEELMGGLVRSRLSAGTGLNSPTEVKRLQSLLAAINALRSDSWSDATSWLQTEMINLSYQEPIVMQGIAASVAPVVIETVLPSNRLLKAIAISRPFEGRLLKEWSASLEAEDLRRVNAAIQMGMVAGESSDAIARRVTGSVALKGKDGVTELTRRQVQAITRTAVQHVANNAREAFLKENADLLLGEQFVATLDTRTTSVCRANDGKQYPVGTGPRPPLHIACRSLRVAALDGESLGNRPAKASTEKQLLREFTEANKLGRVGSRADIPRGMKTKYDEFARKRIRQLTGVIPATTTYQTWLKSQSRQFQEDTLGVTKAKLFRDGGLTLDKFVAADGTELTLGQLATKNKDAFRSVGLDPDGFV